MKRISAVFLTLTAAAVLLFAGCSGKNKVDSECTSIQIHEDGTITHTIIDENPEGYTSEELKNYINGLLEAYNTDPEEPQVTMTKCSKNSGGSLRIILEYASAADYEGFNSLPLFAGTVKEAYLKGYDFLSGFKTPSGLALSGYTLPAEYGDLEVLVLKEPVDVYLPSKALIVSDNAVINEDGSVTVSKNNTSELPEVFHTSNDDLSYLIYSFAEKK